jgi:hypothetical protein
VVAARPLCKFAYVIIIIIIVVVVVAQEPFVGSWPLFQFLDPIHIQQDPFDGESASRKASPHTQNINTE